MRGETDSQEILLSNLKQVATQQSPSITTTTTTANLPEFSLGARTHKTSINSTKLGKSAEKLIQPQPDQLY